MPQSANPLSLGNASPDANVDAEGAAGPSPMQIPSPGASPASRATQVSPGSSVLAQHDYVRATYDQLKTTMGYLDHARQALESLASEGDAVQPEQVIKAAGDLVAKGMDPHQMAGLLATMPQGGGEALASWLEQQSAALEAKEQQLSPMMDGVRQHLGISALHLLAAGHFAGDENMLPAGAPSGGSAPTIH